MKGFDYATHVIHITAYKNEAFLMLDVHIFKVHNWQQW